MTAKHNKMSPMEAHRNIHYYNHGHFLFQTRDYFDATASNWNTSTHSRPLASHFV